jgi:hypothetical protein
MVRDRKKLEAMNKRIAEGRQRVAEQEARVVELRRDGQSTDDATKLLHEIKETLRLMQAHRERAISSPSAAAANSKGAPLTSLLDLRKLRRRQQISKRPTNGASRRLPANPAPAEGARGSKKSNFSGRAETTSAPRLLPKSPAVAAYPCANSARPHP